MNQFMRQMQYYLLFECVECQWCLLLKAIAQAASMDDIIHAHNRFLDNLMRSCFLDEVRAFFSTQTSRCFKTVIFRSRSTCC
jgi:hypothetical protein